MLIATDERGKHLARVEPISDPLASWVTIQPDTWRSGTVELGRYFPRLDDLVNKETVLIYWSYHVPRSIDPAEPWVGGFVAIRAGGCKVPLEE